MILLFFWINRWMMHFSPWEKWNASLVALKLYTDILAVQNAHSPGPCSVASSHCQVSKYDWAFSILTGTGTGIINGALFTVASALAANFFIFLSLFFSFFTFFFSFAFIFFNCFLSFLCFLFLTSSSVVEDEDDELLDEEEECFLLCFFFSNLCSKYKCI